MVPNFVTLVDHALNERSIGRIVPLGTVNQLTAEYEERRFCIVFLSASRSRAVCGPGPSSKVIATAPCSLGVVLGGFVYGFVVVLGFVVVDSLDEGVVSVVVGAVEGEVS
jgi:hypothetical protein